MSIAIFLPILALDIYEGMLSMRTVEARRYARWSAAIAILLAALVGGVYAWRSWQGRQVQKATIPVPPSVQQQSAEFSFSKVVGERTQFTVRASRATEFKEGNRSLLEDVWITAYGKAEQRFDNLHTRVCDYIPATGLITCSGEVQIDLQSSQDAALAASDSSLSPPDAPFVHIRTSNVSFDSKTGVATTDSPVQFRFPQGRGRAIGVRYESQQGKLWLLRNVELTLRAQPTAGTASPSAFWGAGELTVSSSSFVYRRDEHILHMPGPVEARQGSRELRAGALDIEFDGDMRVRRIVASEHPKLTDTQRSEPVSLAADEISALLSPGGWTERIMAAGNVRLDKKSPYGKDRLAARQLEIEYAPGTSQPRRMIATDSVMVQSDLQGEASRRMATSALVIEFAPGERSGDARIARAITPAATLNWRDSQQAAGKASVERMRLTSKQLEASFDTRGELRALHGSGGVEIERQIGEVSVVTSTSREMLARFSPNGDWSSVDQTGDVRLRDGTRTAEAARARFDHAAGSVSFSGSVTLTDEFSRTTAQSAEFVQAAREFNAGGGVVTSERPTGSGHTGNGMPGPAHISADRLEVDTATGRAVYSGRARLWQGDAVIEADRLELDRTSQTLTAIHGVRAIFPHAPEMPSVVAGRPTPGQRQFVDVNAGRMIYAGAESRARLEEGATLRTNEGSIRSTSMDLFFGSQSAPPDSVSGAQAGSPLRAIGTQTLVRATALGDVVIDQGDRHAKAARADYTAAEGRFVLTGGHPTVYDNSGNATTGRQLTFIFADDRIVVDSEEGSRTLTLHRVEK